ncbi:MAG TPA: hypothetical protein VNA19_03415, partial [Pyrinomonadaceae bacterium]|nr:hypothetical protein [Pyrinomonadaceae bacterium]
MRRTSGAAESPDETQGRSSGHLQTEYGREEIDNMRLSEQILNASPSASDSGRDSTRPFQSVVNGLKARLRAARARRASRRRVSPVRRAAVPVVTWLLMFVLVFQPTLILAGTISAKEQGTSPAVASFTRWPNFTNAYTGFASGAQSALNYVSSLFASSEDNAPTEMSAAPSALAVPTPTPDHSVRDAAISRQTPNINSGRILGSLRVFEGKSYSLNNAFTL